MNQFKENCQEKELSKYLAEADVIADILLDEPNISTGLRKTLDPELQKIIKNGSDFLLEDQR